MVNRKESATATLIRDLREACRRPLFEEIVLVESKLAVDSVENTTSSTLLSGSNHRPPFRRSASSGGDLETASQTSSAGRGRGSGKQRSEAPDDRKSWPEVSKRVVVVLRIITAIVVYLLSFIDQV